MKKEKERK